MDLYEALKTGTTEEELLKKFHKELEEAADRLAKETAEQEAATQKAEELEDAREFLIDSIIEYAEALYGEQLNEDKFCWETIEETLKGFEKDFLNLSSFGKKIDKIIKEVAENDGKTPVGFKITTHIGDDEIIRKFIDSLK